MNTTEEALIVADLMSDEPIVVAFDAPIEQAERLMRTYRVGGLPVVDNGGHLVGVISQTDFMYLRDPEVSRLIHHRNSGIRVGEVMSRPPVCVEMTTPIADAARMMRDELIHRVVVIDDSQRPIGVLSASDFVSALAEG